MNKLTVVGNLTRDAESKGDYMLLDVAQNQYDKDGEDNKHTHYMRIVWFNKNSDKLADIFRKGKQGSAVGTMKVTTNEKDGKTYTNISVLCNNNDVALPPKEGSSDGFKAPF